MLALVTTNKEYQQQSIKWLFHSLPPFNLLFLCFPTVSWSSFLLSLLSFLLSILVSPPDSSVWPWEKWPSTSPTPLQWKLWSARQLCCPAESARRRPLPSLSIGEEMASRCLLTGQLSHSVAFDIFHFAFLSLFVIILHLFTCIFFRHHQQPNGSLLVGPLTKSDSGWFLCVATREQERDHRYIYLSVSGNAVHLYEIISCNELNHSRFMIK